MNWRHATLRDLIIHMHLDHQLPATVIAKRLGMNLVVDVVRDICREAREEDDDDT